MSILSEKKTLTEGELKELKVIQKQTQDLVFEFGEISLIRLQLEKRYNLAQGTFDELSNLEKSFSKSIYEKYGKVEIMPETGEIVEIK
jgi:hypothetical protein